MSYPKPKRARARWLQGAPEYVLDVFDNKGKTADRYTVVFGGSLADNNVVHFLGLSDNPSSPQGVSMWGELTCIDMAAYRYRIRHQRARWLDLPEHVREHIVMRCTEGDC